MVSLVSRLLDKGKENPSGVRRLGKVDPGGPTVDWSVGLGVRTIPSSSSSSDNTCPLSLGRE